VSARNHIENIRDALITQKVQESKKECCKMGIPEQHFSESVARRQHEQSAAPWIESIIQYLEETQK
jgi:hypothetical protein